MNTKSFFITLLAFSTCLANGNRENTSCKQTLYNIDLPSIGEFKDLVKKFFDKVTKVIQNTDPYSVNYVNWDHHSYGITSEGDLSNLLISGPSSIKFNQIDVNDDETLNFSIDLNMKHIQCLGSYKLNFDMFTMLSMYGNGQMGVAISGIHFFMQTTLKQLLDKRLQLTELHLDFSIEDAKVDIDSILNSTYRGTYLSSLLSELLPLVFNELPPLKTYGSIGAMAAVNSLMCDKGTTLDFVIEFMQKFTQ